MLTLCFAAFLLFGVGLVLVGANQAALAAELSLDLSRSGLLGSALALGIGLGVVGAGPLFDRFPRRPLFVAAALVAGVALLGVGPDMSYPRWLAQLVAVGVGLGAYDTLINAVVVQRYRERSARPMALVHAAATLGAMAGPFLVWWIAAHHSFTASFTWLGWAHLGLAGWALLVPLPPPEPPHPPGDAAPARALSPALVPFAAIAFAYVGVETAATVFAVPYATGALRLGAERGRAAISAFWLGLLLGRLGIAALRGALDARVVGRAGVLGAAALAGAVALRIEIVELPFLATGIALGSVYPLMIALVGQRFPRARGTAAGIAAGAGALGGFAVPWLTGALGDAAGVRAAVASLALWCLAVAGAAAAARRLR